MHLSFVHTACRRVKVRCLRIELARASIDHFEGARRIEHVSGGGSPLETSHIRARCESPLASATYRVIRFPLCGGAVSQGLDRDLLKTLRHSRFAG